MQKKLTVQEFFDNFLKARPWLKKELDGCIEEIANKITSTFDTDLKYNEIEIEEIIIKYVTDYLKN